MNPYVRLSSMAGSLEAASLGMRLALWHDEMVAHERRLRAGVADPCGDDCPHAEAEMLWTDAVATFGGDAEALTFLRSRASAALPDFAPT